MRTDLDARNVQTVGGQEKRSFSISLRNMAHIMGILRSSLYPDKVLAVIREYSTNAWDAHQSIGKRDVPIEVTLPTYMEPTLIIRDNGPGMSEAEIFDLYTQYGESTKRGTNEENGMLGIGSKSGFAYSDTFTVTSFNGGMRRVYIAVLDETDVGEIQLMDEEPCGDETGVEIKVPVNPKDVNDFERKAQALFQYFVPQPKINTTLPKPPKMIKDIGFFHESDEEGYHHNSRGWVAVMGCIPYRVNVKQLQEDLEEAGVALETLERLSGGLMFSIGDVQFASSREEVKYTTKTKKALAARFAQLIDAYVEETLDALQGSTLTEWDKRIRTLRMINQLKVRIPERYEDYTKKTVSLNIKETAGTPPTVETIQHAPKTFTLIRQRQAVHGINVESQSRLVIKDDPRPLEGFDFEHRDYLIRPSGKATLEEVRAELTALLERFHLTGIPIENLSEMDWHSNRHNSNAPRTPNEKHRVTTFRLRDDRHAYNFPFSECWTIEQREPTDQDVFVIISGFQAVGEDHHFFDLYTRDRKAAKLLGSPMPAVYGYKTTLKEPRDEKTIQGTPYHTWRKAFLQGLLTPETMETLQQQKWSGILNEEGWHARDLILHTGAVIARLKIRLGDTHQLVVFLEQFKEYRSKAKALGESKVDALKHLISENGRTDIVFKADAEKAAIYKAYPLLRLESGMSKLAGTDAKEWLDYVEMVDFSKSRAHSQDSGSIADQDESNSGEELVV